MDQAVAAIEARSPADLSFQWLRGTFAREIGVQHSMARGRAILYSIEQLDQYLWSYGPMISSQWQQAASLLPALRGSIRWIDHGCGQGLAGLVLWDVIGPGMFDQVREMMMIEPSLPALRRALAIYRRLMPDVPTRWCTKRFDNLTEDDFRFEDELDTVHIFSNVFDMPDFDPLALLGKVLQPGRHLILAVGHDRPFGGSPYDGDVERVARIRRAVEDPRRHAHRTVWRSRFERFTCDNPSRSAAMAWLCELEVHRG